MAYIGPFPTVTKLKKVNSSQKYFNEKDDDESDISKNIRKLNNEEVAHSQKDEKNIEENLRNVVCDVISTNEESYSNQEKLENNKTTLINSTLVNICPSDGINQDKSNKELELKVDKYYDAANGSNTVKKKCLNFGSDSIEEINLHEILNKSSNDNYNDEYHSDSSETDLQIAKRKNNSKNKNLRAIIDSESEEDTQTSKSNNIPQINTAESYRALIDSESDEEKQNEKTENDTFITSKERKSKDTKKSVKKRRGSIRASKDEAMRQIHSESQRLLRETEISLPYHRPKQRTLQEFLNRKKISVALPKAPSTAAKLKMSSAIVSQVLAEKEKEAELFYKCSDSEDDEQQSIPLVSKDIKKSIINEKEMSLLHIDRTCIQDLKIQTNTQDFQDKEIIQKDHSDLNAFRCQILLEKDFCQVDHQAIELSSLTNNNTNPDDSSDALLRQIMNEYNQNLPKPSLSRMLSDIHEDGSNNDSEINHDKQEATTVVETITSLNKEKCISDEKKSKIVTESKISKVQNDFEINLDKQETTKEVVETITSLNKEKCINDEKKSKIVTENKISKVQNDSDVINGRDKNLVTKATKMSGMLSNNINSKEIIEIIQNDDIIDNICSNSNECIIMKNTNNEKKDKYSEVTDVSPALVINDTQLTIQDNSSDECEKFDGHVQGLPLPKFADETSMNRKKLSALVSNSKITLRGSPGMIIDLTDDAKSSVKSVNTLLDRFFDKHVNTKVQNDNKFEVIAVQNMQNDIFPIKETLPFKVPVNTNNSELNMSGTKLMRLKENLKLQMTLKRNKEWKQKEIELQAQQEEELNWEEKSDSDLDDEENAGPDFELSDSEESEPEENDICIKDKKISKCLFVDDEAEITDNEDSSTEETCDESDMDHVKHSGQSASFKYRKEYMDDDVSEIEIDQEEDTEDKNEDKEEDEENLNVNTENENESDFKDDDNINACKNFGNAKNKNKRKTRQLVEEFQDDSNITNPSYLRNDNSQLNATDIDTSKIHCENNGWISENESNMSASQFVEVSTRNQICKTPLTKTSMLDLVSPITQLSVLNTTLDSNKKVSSQNRECLADNHEFLSMENTQNDESFEHVCNITKKCILKKKLFDDIGETIDDEYLMRLCSGKFESTQRTDLNLFLQSNTTKSQLHPSESECPGNSTKLIDIEQSKNPKVNDEMLQDIKLTLDEESNHFVNHARKINKVSAMHSELKLRVISSDDEDEDTFLKPKKRLVKRLNLSDSEEENLSSQFSNDEDDEDNADNEEAEEQYVDYDSEENEMIIVPKKDIKKVAANFVEEEAELSESNWDSADEDEKDLDELEFDEADDEHIDEHEMKDQLKKIHMKQVLDQDKREVKLLKELLFEDGDLHTDGMGRERKFKWRNIDKLENNIDIPQIYDENDGWVDVQEDEEEVKWSKLRHERDKFLEERMKKCLNNEIEDELCDSQIFKLGLEAVRKIKDNELQRQNTSLDKIDPSKSMEPIIPRNITDLLNGPNIEKKSQTIYNDIKKHSLLTRGEESLARIASLAKQGDFTSHVVNKKNFVFPHIDQNRDNTFKKETEITAEYLDSPIKPGKRKMMSNISVTKKRRK